MDKDLISITGLSAQEIHSIITLARDIKKNTSKYSKMVDHKTLAMIFEKPSLRTRVSFETGFSKMGGHAIYLSKNDIQLGRGESIEDTAKVLSRYVDIIMARVFEYSTIAALAKNATVPVINGLTNTDHPCQILGDLQTIEEHLGSIENLKFAFLGDCASNMSNTYLEVAPKIGMELRLGFPKGFGPSESLVKAAKGCILTNDPKEAVKGADVVCTDTWMSMQIPDSEKPARLKAFGPFQVTKELMKLAKPKAVFMHCLPCHRGEEVAADVIDGPQSIVIDEAENRMWIQNAIMLKLMKLA